MGARAETMETPSLGGVDPRHSCTVLVLLAEARERFSACTPLPSEGEFLWSMSAYNRRVVGFGARSTLLPFLSPAAEAAPVAQRRWGAAGGGWVRGTGVVRAWQGFFQPGGGGDAAGAEARGAGRYFLDAWQPREQEHEQDLRVRGGGEEQPGTGCVVYGGCQFAAVGAVCWPRARSSLWCGGAVRHARSRKDR